MITYEKSNSKKISELPQQTETFSVVVKFDLIYKISNLEQLTCRFVNFWKNCRCGHAANIKFGYLNCNKSDATGFYENNQIYTKQKGVRLNVTDL